MFGWARKVREIAGDGVPIRDGITYTEDQKRVLDMLCLCGELGGPRPNESYSSYLRRLIDRVIVSERALTKIEKWFGEFPETGQFWDNRDGTKSDRPMSYAACFGSNGERDFMRGVARAALGDQQTGTEPK